MYMHIMLPYKHYLCILLIYRLKKERNMCQYVLITLNCVHVCIYNWCFFCYCVRVFLQKLSCDLLYLKRNIRLQDTNTITL